jgi:hypothetical protein
VIDQKNPISSGMAGDARISRSLFFVRDVNHGKHHTQSTEDLLQATHDPLTVNWLPLNMRGRDSKPMNCSPTSALAVTQSRDVQRLRHSADGEASAPRRLSMRSGYRNGEQ